jgi:hypothetical protein
LGYASNAMVGLPSIEIVAPDARARIAAIVKQQTADEHDISYSRGCSIRCKAAGPRSSFLGL